MHDSDELYLLATESDASVKVRDGSIDVKRLQDVNDDGLEQWLPVLKAAFPLPAADVGAVLEALRVTAPPSARSAYTLDQLLAELVHPAPELLAVPVHKRRTHYTVGGCMTELSEIRAAGGTTRTIAVESADPALVIAAVRELELDSRPNVCVPRGLKTLVGFGARRYAAIDVGTNSVKLVVGERQADGTWRTVVDRVEITRLGEGLEQSGRLGAEPAERTLEAIDCMFEQARGEGAVEIAAVGTAGLRLAENRAEFVEAAKSRCGIEIEILSGEEEGRLAYLAATAGLPRRSGSLVVFDSGGGSSQFTFGDGERVDERFSLDVGAVRFTEHFGLDRAVSEEVLAAALAAIDADLSPLDGRPTPDALVAIGGTVTNLAAVRHGLAAYDPDVVRGTVLDRAEIDRQIELFRTRDADDRRAIVGLQPKRAEVILAGACIVRTVLEKLGSESVAVSDRGLRHGLLLDRFSG